MLYSGSTWQLSTQHILYTLGHLKFMLKDYAAAADLYDVLGVAREATTAEIKKAYRSLAAARPCLSCRQLQLPLHQVPSRTLPSSVAGTLSVRTRAGW